MNDYLPIEYYSTILGILEDVGAREWWLTQYVEETRTHSGPWRLSVNVSDVFMWACADAETVEEDELEAYRQAWSDYPHAGDLLFAARKRKERPQGAMFKYLSVDYHQLFLDAGPEKKVGLGNPYGVSDDKIEPNKSLAKNPLRSEYPLANVELLDVLPTYSGFGETCNLSIPRVKADGEVIILTAREDGPGEELSVAEYLKLVDLINKTEDQDSIWNSIWDHLEAGTLRKLL